MSTNIHPCGKRYSAAQLNELHAAFEAAPTHAAFDALYQAIFSQACFSAFDKVQDTDIAQDIASNVGSLITRSLPNYVNPYPAADKPLKHNAYRSTHPDHQQYLDWKLYESNKPLKGFSGDHVTKANEVTRGFSAYLSSVIRTSILKHFRDAEDNERLDALTVAHEISEDGREPISIGVMAAANVIDVRSDFIDSASEVSALVDVCVSRGRIGEQDERQRRINQLNYIIRGSRLLGTRHNERQAGLDGWKFNPVAVGAKGFKAGIEADGNRSNIAIKYCRAAEVLAEYGKECDVKPTHFEHCPHSHDIGDNQRPSLITEALPHEIGEDGRIQTITWGPDEAKDQRAAGKTVAVEKRTPEPWTVPGMILIDIGWSGDRPIKPRVFWLHPLDHEFPGYSGPWRRRRLTIDDAPIAVEAEDVEAEIDVEKIARHFYAAAPIPQWHMRTIVPMLRAALILRRQRVEDAFRPQLWKGISVLNILTQWQAEDAEKLQRKRLREEAGIVDQPHECTAQCRRIKASTAIDSDKLADLCWQNPAKHCSRYLKKLARDFKTGRIQALQYDRELENVTRLTEDVANDEMDISSMEVTA